MSPGSRILDPNHQFPFERGRSIHSIRHRRKGTRIVNGPSRAAALTFNASRRLLDCAVERMRDVALAFACTLAATSMLLRPARMLPHHKGVACTLAATSSAPHLPSLLCCTGAASMSVISPPSHVARPGLCEGWRWRRRRRTGLLCTQPFSSSGQLSNKDRGGGKPEEAIIADLGRGDEFDEEDEDDDEDEDYEDDEEWEDYIWELGQVEASILSGDTPPSQVDAEEVIEMMRVEDDDVDAAMEALHADENTVALTVNQALSPDDCRVLRDYADEHVSSCGTVDAMDGEAECQVVLSRAELELLIGQETVATLWELPQALEVVRVDGHPTLPPVWLATVGLRRYVAGGGIERSQLGFHVDSDHCTANVNLSPPGAHRGGKLVLAVGEKIKEYARGEGDATVHIGEVAHAVTQVKEGRRYALLLFYNRPGFMFQRHSGRYRQPSSKPSN